MASGRAVRIPRVAGLPGEPALAPRPVPSPARFVPNAGGTGRAVRVFVLFLAMLLIVYVGFLALAAASPDPGVRSDPVTLGILSALALALAVGGWGITLGRAPRGVRFDGPEIVVLERFGRQRRFVAPPALELRVAYRYAAGILGPEPTELVEVTSTDGRRRAYLVDRGLLGGT